MAETVQDAHDTLLGAMPPGARHDPCPLCPASRDTAKEVAEVAERTFTETEHFALTTADVTRETATIAAERDELKTQLAEFTQRADVLEATQVTLTAERDAITAAFEAYKADLEAKAAVEDRKTARVEKVKAANEALRDDFYTAERVQRWAEMSDEAFETVLDGIGGAKTTTATKPPAMVTAAFTGGQSPAAVTGSVLGQYLRLGRSPAGKH